MISLQTCDQCGESYVETHECHIECDKCDGYGRIWNNSDETSGQWVECDAVLTAEKQLEREEEIWDALNHARWYVGAYKPLTRTMANEQAELLAKIIALASGRDAQQ